ncbi:hypothetical protein [Rhizobium sullae]|uniref:hypothetical protein n=1 Tax=Rhizobium sullae TaxID=50338 RepID=UPI001FCCED48|nr:hypothetical protein [Rhizobium sullae]
MRNDPKDRHVVAAAVAVKATVIVTSNIRDFGTLLDGIVAQTPDEFLSEIFAKNPIEVLKALTIQAAVYRRPALTTRELTERLSRRLVSPRRRSKLLMTADLISVHSDERRLPSPEDC